MKPSGVGSEKNPSPTVRSLARRAYPTSKGFQRAFIRGWYGRLAGRSVDANPYRGRLHGKRRRYGKGNGGTTENGTFTFAWRAAWERGWHARRETE